MVQNAHHLKCAAGGCDQWWPEVAAERPRNPKTEAAPRMKSPPPRKTTSDSDERKDHTAANHPEEGIEVGTVRKLFWPPNFPAGGLKCLGGVVEVHAGGRREELHPGKPPYGEVSRMKQSGWKVL